MLVISLTSFPARIGFVHKTIETLLDQSMKADKVVLYLAKEQFKDGEASLPKPLLDLRGRGLEIRWCEDLKSYKKLVPALKEYPDSIVVTADDDILYPRGWLKDLYVSYLKNPDEIHCHRAHRMTFEKDGSVAPYADWIWGVRNVCPSFNNFLTGVGGVLYPPNSLHEDVLNDEQFRRLCPTADDIWFWAMAVLKGSKINVIGKHGCELRYVKDSQEANCLQMINLGENRNDSQLRNVLSKYPEILGKLEKNPIKRRRKLSFLEKLFSFKSQKDGKGAKYKVVTVFGISFGLKTAKVVTTGGGERPHRVDFSAFGTNDQK